MTSNKQVNTEPVDSNIPIICEDFNPNVADVFAEWHRFYHEFVHQIHARGFHRKGDRFQKILFFNAMGYAGVQFMQKFVSTSDQNTTLAEYILKFNKICRAAQRLKPLREKYFKIVQKPDQPFQEFYDIAVNSAEECCFVEAQYVILGLLIKGTRYLSTMYALVSEDNLNLDNALTIGICEEQKMAEALEATKNLLDQSSDN